MGFGSLETKKKWERDCIFFFGKNKLGIGIYLTISPPTSGPKHFYRGFSSADAIHFGGIIRLKFDRAVM